MPTAWKHHADGVNTAVSTSHSLDGTLKSATLQLETFRTREWGTRSGESEDTDLNGESIPHHAHWDEVDRVFVEHSDGAHATLRFDGNDGSARLQSIEPEACDTVEPRHMPLLRAAERILRLIDGVSPGAIHTIGQFEEAYKHAEGIHIDALDA